MPRQPPLDDDIVFEDACWRVLVADDSPTIRASLERMCAAFGTRIELTEVTNGADCLDALASGGFDLAFIDIHFPDVSGLDALKAARLAGSRTFVVVISSAFTADSVRVAKALRAYEFLPKPFTDAQVRSVLSSYAEIRMSKSVLLVDDSGTARRLMSRVLDRSAFDLHIVEASDAVTGFELYARRPTDLIMLDLNMSGLHGREAARIFRAHRPDCRIVLVSGDRDGLRDVGPHVATLAKPFDAAALDAVLHRLFRLRMPFEDVPETETALV